jgi:anti-sigma factor RsiW
MREFDSHPEDFSPYLDRDFADKRYEEIRLHLEACPDCQEELKTWHSLDSMIRAGEMEIQVPPFQWARIRERLQEHRAEPAILEQWGRLFKSRRLAWSTALGLLMAIAVTYGGFEYRKNVQAKEYAALVAFSESEERRINAAGNPFSAIVDSAQRENPFSEFQAPSKINPFSIRQ